MKAVFLDRDGVINEYPGDFKYVVSWKEFHFIKGIEKPLKKLADQGFALFIISNQAGVSKGIYTQATLDSITNRFLEILNSKKVPVAGVYYCTHSETDNCSCRKPKIGLLHKAIANFENNSGKQIDIKESYFVGDTIRDVKTGKAAGLMTILVFTGKEKQKSNSWEEQPDFVASDLSEATGIILKK